MKVLEIGTYPWKTTDARDLLEEAAHARQADTGRYWHELHGELEQRLQEAQRKGVSLDNIVCISDKWQDAMKERDELRDVLESVQWLGGVLGHQVCPRCARSEEEGHNDVCKIAAALPELEGE